jgi:NAD+ kinase
MIAAVDVVGLLPHRDRPEALRLAADAAAWLRAHGVTVRLPADEAHACGVPELGVARDDFADGLDLAVSFGGDGTMLRSVDLLARDGVPVLGVNVGRLGYLTEIEPEHLHDALQCVLDGRYEIDERMLLRLVVRSRGPAGGEWWALNEGVLEKTHSGRLARVAVAVNGKPFTTYSADGLIVATPTGSTAYSFSARGPIASPRLRCVLLTPVSPHMLFDRTLVLDGDEELRLEVLDDHAIGLTVDGREVGELEQGAVVLATAAPQPARLVSVDGRDFHQVVRAKFGLPRRPGDPPDVLTDDDPPSMAPRDGSGGGRT